MSIRINNLAELKRALKVGTKVETLALASGINGGKNKVGDVRFVKYADTTGVYLHEDEGIFLRGSFLGFGKAKDWVFEGAKFSNVKYGYAYKIID